MPHTEKGRHRFTTTQRMKKRLPSAGALLLLGTLLASTRSYGQTRQASPANDVHANWPIFRGNAQLTGVSPNALPENPELLWTCEIGRDVEGSTVIWQETVFATALDSHLYAIDLHSGKIKWKYRGAEESKASPAVAEGVAYFGDESGAFHAVEVTTGKQKWQYQTDAGVISSANFYQERVIFGSYDHQLYCLQRNDGALLWKLETDGYLHATPTLVGENVIIGGCDGLIRLVRIRDGAEIKKISAGAYVAASMAVSENRAYVGTFGNKVLCLNAGTGELIWQYDPPQRDFPFFASAAVRGEIVVAAGRDKTVYALNAQTGQALWQYAAKTKIDASPVIAGTRVFVATMNGEILAFELNSGKISWRFETGSAFVASPAVANGKLVIGSLDGTVYCFGKK